LAPRYSVLIVDPLEETREVLRTALEARGVRILATDEPAQGLALARLHGPDLIVLDIEHLADSPERLSDGFAAQSRARCTPLVLLGNARVRRGGRVAPQGEFVAKPYHYAPLIRKIEELLAQCQQPIARAA
jgi:CheY-like chemotaxis protein